MTKVMNCARHSTWYDYGDQCPSCAVETPVPWQCPKCRYWVDDREHECVEMVSLSSALDVQVGGAHYKEMSIQPVEYVLANRLGFCEGNVVKYVSRWKEKGGVEDLKKARHYLDLLIEHESGMTERADR
jgi:hypothetical protein